MSTRRIVVAYDGSIFSRHALSWSLRAARGRGVKLVIAHVGDRSEPSPDVVSTRGPDVSVQSGQSILAEAVAAARLEAPGVDVAPVHTPGPLVPAFLELLEGAELGVVGCRGLGVSAERYVGSSSTELAERARCPLVVVRTTYYAVPGPEAGRVVVGVDFSSAASAAADFAVEEAQRHGLGLTVVHAWDVAGEDAADGPSRAVEHMVVHAERKARRALTEWLAPWMDARPGLDVRQRPVRSGAISDLVAASAGAHLVVVGNRGVCGDGSVMLGSVSRALLHRALSPVAIVRPCPRAAMR